MSGEEVVTRITVLPTGASIDDEDVSAWWIDVEHRGRDLYAVRHMGRGCLSVAGTWDYEPSPSNRDDDWLVEHRFDLAGALAAAHVAVDLVVVNGMTWADVMVRREEQS